MSVTMLSREEKLRKANNLWTNEFQKQKNMRIFFPGEKAWYVPTEGLALNERSPVAVIEISELRPVLLFKIITAKHITFSVDTSKLRKLEERYDR